MDRRFLSDQPIAQGRTADVFGYGDDKVVKLLRPGFARSMISDEADRLEAASAAGAPCPAPRGVVEVSGRIGLAMDRVDGELLIDEAAFAPMRVSGWAKRFAAVHVAVMSCETSDLPLLTDILAEKIEAADLTKAHRDKALSILAAAPEADAVLHGDFHPGNVIVDDSDATVVDWIDAARGSPSADVARTLWLLSPATVSESVPNRRVALTLQSMFRKSYVKHVTRAMRINRRVIDAWRLPVVAARLAEGVVNEDVALHAEVRRLTGD